MSTVVKKKVMIPVCNGYNEIEVASVLGVFREAGITVYLTSVQNDLKITSANGMIIIADRHITNCNMFFDAVVLPGNESANKTMRKSAILRRIISETKEWGVVGALGAAPAVVLAHWGMLSSPAVCQTRPDLRNVVSNSAVWGNMDPCLSIDKKLVTSAGQGNSIMLGLMMVEILLGPEKADEIGDAMGVPVDAGEDEKETEKENGEGNANKNMKVPA